MKKQYPERRQKSAAIGTRRSDREEFDFEERQRSVQKGLRFGELEGLNRHPDSELVAHRVVSAVRLWSPWCGHRRRSRDPIADIYRRAGSRCTGFDGYVRSSSALTTDRGRPWQADEVVWTIQGGETCRGRC